MSYPTYSAVMEAQSVSAAQDLFELTAPTTKAVRLLRVEVGQDTIETSEVLPIRIRRGIGATAGSGGAAVTPVNLRARTAAASATVARNNTTPATAGSGSLTTLVRRDFNVVTGFVYEPAPGQQPEIAPGEILVVHLPTAPSGAMNFTCEMVFEEIS